MANNDVNRLIDLLYERVEDAKSPTLKPTMCQLGDFASSTRS